MTGPYAEEDIDLLVRTLWARANDRRLRPDEPTPRGSVYRDQARAVLAALAAAGRLVPPGSEVREEWGARISHDDNPDGAYESWRGRLGSEEMVAAHALSRATNSRWRGRAVLVRRRIIVTPPELVATPAVPVEGT